MIAIATPSSPNDRQNLEQDEEFRSRLNEAEEEAKSNAFLLAGKLHEMAAKHNALADRIEHLEQELQQHHKTQELKRHD